MTIHLPRLVGIGGFARCGKDTIAKALVDEYGYTRYSFADPIRDALYALNPLVQADNTGRTFRLAEVVDELGWDEAKAAAGGEIRRLLQVLGTEVAREQWGDGFWLLRADEFIQSVWPNPVVIPDVRFENEATLIAGYGYLLKVVRPGYAPINGHVSDAGLPDSLFEGVVCNDSTIDVLQQRAIDLLKAAGIR